MAKKNNLPEAKLIRVLLTILVWALTAGVITFSILTFTQASKSNFEGASKYMALTFVLLGVAHLLGHFKDNEGSLPRAIILATINIGLGVLVFFAKYNVYIFSISAGVFALSIIISRIFKLIKKHTVRDIVLNVILITLSIVLAVGFFLKVENDFISNVVLLECLFISLYVFIEAAIVTLNRLKFTAFANVLTRTFALEILLGLAALIVGASLILIFIEPSMSNFADALWYCFAVVTTIGFGDFVAVTPIGRVVTVFLGIYGIVVVAVLTSIVVNFYNETYSKRKRNEEK